MSKNFLCAMLGHRRNRNKVWHDDRFFRTRCTRCSTELIRENNGWRELDPDKDILPGVQSQPH